MFMAKIANEMKRLKSSVHFKEYIKKNPDNYLASCFQMGKSGLQDASWQFDFYSMKSGKMTSFQMGKSIAVQKDQEIFSKGTYPKKLKLGLVKVEFNDAMSRAGTLIKKKLPNESINKEIVILQEMDDKAVWNITLLTSAFNIMNIRIDANSGDVIQEKCESILSFRISR